jgi:hypothetical protein
MFIYYLKDLTLCKENSVQYEIYKIQKAFQNAVTYKCNDGGLEHGLINPK